MRRKIANSIDQLRIYTLRIDMRILNLRILMRETKMAAEKYPIRTAEQLIPLFQAFRKQKNLTQAQLATRLGVGQQTVSQLERHPDKATLERLLRALAAMDVEMVLIDKSTSEKAPETSPNTGETW